MSVTIITGCPGAGKTTLAALLATGRTNGVHLFTDNFYDGIKNRIDPWLAEARHQNESVVRAYSKASASLSEDGYAVFIDGVVGPWMFPLIEPVVDGFEYVLLSIELEHARERVRQRALAAAAEVQETGLEMMHPQFDAVERRFGKHVICVSGKTPDELVAEYERKSADGMFYRPADRG